MNSVKIAGPRITPQNPNVLMPESIEKKISISLIFAGFSTKRELINFITSGFTKLSASVEISITQYAIITIAPEVLPPASTYSAVGT